MEPSNSDTMGGPSFLQGSLYCDVMHPTIHTLAQAVTRDARSQTDKAQRLTRAEDRKKDGRKQRF